MQNNWNSLDNAAKIFPSAGGKTDTQVFRFSCELFERVDGEILQRALDETIGLFGVFRCVLRRGVFWYYFEDTDIKPKVRREYKRPCAPLYSRDYKSLLFEVTYFENRINFEVFHSLTDGTGAVNFIKTLAAKYLVIAKKLSEPQLSNGASSAQMEKDSFKKYYSGTKLRLNKKPERAYEIKGARLVNNGMRMITGLCDTDQLVAAAHRYKGSVTAFISAALMTAIKEDASVRSLRRPVVVNIPVNLRKYFKSDTARNFFGVFPASYKFGRSDPNDPELLFSDVVKKVDADIRKNLRAEEISKLIDTYSGAENNLFARMAPLFFKDMVLKAAYAVNMKGSTATVSNIGVVTMPDELKGYIRSFGFYAGTAKVQACVTSFNGKTSICFTSPFISTDIPMYFFRRLTEQGIKTEITANSPEEK